MSDIGENSKSMKTTFIHEIRAVKNKKELANIIRAQRISEKVLGRVLANLKTGVSEIETANLIKKSFIKEGAPVLSFPPIVAFGKNSANIHHIPGKTKLKKGDMVMFDFGCAVSHYCSDMTRTYFWGEPSLKQKKIYLAVLEAQNRVLSLIKKGERRAGVIDASARKFLAKKYKNNFKPKSEDILPVGSVMTVEPGLYFKDWGGVRIEDMVLIARKGYKNLTNIPKDLSSAILK